MYIKARVSDDVAKQFMNSINGRLREVKYSDGIKSIYDIMENKSCEITDGFTFHVIIGDMLVQN
jgi:hypothetical protein